MFKKILIIVVILIIIIFIWSDFKSFVVNMFGDINDNDDYSIIYEERSSDSENEEVESVDHNDKAKSIIGKTIVVDSVEYEIDQYINDNLEQNYYCIDDESLYDDYMKILFLSLVNNKKVIEVSGLNDAMIEKYANDIFAIVSETEYVRYFEGFEWIQSGNDVVSIEYKYDDEILQSYIQSKEIAKQISKEIFSPDMNDVQKAKAAYDYLILNTEYSKEAATYVNSDFLPRNHASAYESYGVFADNKAVCQGYAYAFNMLLGLQGIENRYVQSESLNHGWSMIEIDDNWYHCDLTYDDPIPDREGITNHKFFLKNDEYMFDIEPERLGNISRDSNANSYYYEIYDYEFYILNDVDYVYLLEGDAVVRYHTDSGGAIDFDSGKTVVGDVSSWHDIEDDYRFLYTQKSDGDLYQIDFDGRNAKRLVKDLGGYIIDVEKESDELIVTLIDSINGDKSIVTIN